ncbi:hypothetical protein BSLA_02f1069 [Burkholderia stabilis]|nr:hypothetical protein BSLA_02f1069 [Burkholderia stabilis]
MVTALLRERRSAWCPRICAFVCVHYIAQHEGAVTGNSYRLATQRRHLGRGNGFLIDGIENRAAFAYKERQHLGNGRRNA